MLAAGADGDRASLGWSSSEPWHSAGDAELAERRSGGAARTEVRGGQSAGVRANAAPAAVA
jgi:hypothetical protein